MSRAAARNAAEERLKQGQPQPEKLPNALLMAAIKLDTALFQFRHPQDYVSDAHKHELSKTAKAGEPLESVLVWWGGDGFYCIDGHHRLAAYRLAKWDPSRLIPVRVFTGSVVKAMLQSGTNMRPKLGATKPEQSQTAWEQVCTLRIAEASAKDIARSACVSERQVMNMRAVKKALLTKDTARDLSAENWYKVRKEYDGTLEENEPEIDYEERDRVEGERMAAILSRYLGDRGRTRPEAMAHALELYSAPLVPFLLEHWQGMEIDREEGEMNPDF